MSKPNFTVARAEERPERFGTTDDQELVTIGGAEHFRKPTERPFLASERATTTLLFSGLTAAHEEITVGHLIRLGLKVERLPDADQESFQSGKEFCNRGQCNPTYFTIGNLIRHIKKLAAESSVAEVEENYVYLTAGSCGPCRFGMYESEYRKAVIDAGFPNFRIIVMQQAGGLDQIVDKDEKPGFEINREFVVGFLQSLLIGDCINQMWFKIEPYETIPGSTKVAKEKATAMVREAMEQGKSPWRALRRSKALFDGIDCDFTRIKPIVKVTGEFWASITESEGNYFLKQWLMDEGAEVTQEPLTGWVEHLLFSREIAHSEARGVAESGVGPRAWIDPLVREAKFFALRRVLNAAFTAYRAAFNFMPNNTVSNRTLANNAHPYYNKRLGGGEAYMEVGGLIHVAKHKKVHMMISVKPFGCMPSTASDGVQSRVMNDYPQVIFLPIETSGDSEVNFKSRVQMKLFEAKQKAKEEARATLDELGIDVDEVRRFVDKNPQYQRGTFLLNKTRTGTGISFIVEMHRRMTTISGRARHALSGRRTPSQRG